MREKETPCQLIFETGSTGRENRWEMCNALEMKCIKNSLGFKWRRRSSKSSDNTQGKTKSGKERRPGGEREGGGPRPDNRMKNESEIHALTCRRRRRRRRRSKENGSRWCAPSISSSISVSVARAKHDRLANEFNKTSKTKRVKLEWKQNRRQAQRGACVFGRANGS